MNSARRLLFGGLLVLVAFFGYLAAHAALKDGRASGGGAMEHSGQRAHRDRGLPSVVPVAPSTVVPLGVSDSERGAVAAAARYLQLLDQASTVATTETAVRAVTVPPLQREALTAEAGGAAVKRRLLAEGPAFIMGWRLGWRTLSYTPTTARIEVWAMGLVESQREVVAPSYSTTVCSLRWTSTGWAVFAATTRPGPTPPPDGSDPAAVASFVSSAAGFRPFGDAP